MGENERGIRDGSGPYKDSYRRKVEEQDIGRRQEADEQCPSAEQKKSESKDSE